MSAEEKQGVTGERGHETRDFSMDLATYFVISLFILMVIASFLMGRMFDYLAAQHAREDVPPPPLAYTRPLEPPAPRLQVNPSLELSEVRQTEEALLTSYGWVQKEAGVVRIPIERAKQLLLERGLPVREQPAKPQGEDQ